MEELNCPHIDDPVLRAITTYENHPSIVAIKEKYKLKHSFEFKPVTPAEVSQYISTLDASKASQENDIPTKIIKTNNALFSQFLATNFDICLENGHFPTELKSADITPAHKKDSKHDTSNYRPISILPNLSKIIEKCMYTQLYNYFEFFLSDSQYGFRKGYSSQQCLLTMVEKWKKNLDKGGSCGALLTDLSKAFDCLEHDLSYCQTGGLRLEPPFTTTNF